MSDLPSRYQIGDKVSVHGRAGEVIGVYFEGGQIAYTVWDDRSQTQAAFRSEDVFPEDSALRSVK